MRKWLKSLVILVVAVLFVTGCSTDQPGQTQENEDTNGNIEESDIKIGLSISTLNNPFFVTLRDGAEEAAEEAGFKIITSDAQDDPTKQLSDVEDMLQQEVDVLLINPTDSEAVVSAVELANDADVPVITVDRNSEGGEVVTHIASDNVAGGEMAAEFILEKLSDEGNVVEIEGIPGASAARERGEGFHNIIDDVDTIDLVASQTANFDRTEGLTVMENIIQSSSDIDAVFAHNDEMALGALEALEGQGLLEDVILVGFDATDDAVEAVEAGRMDATIAQQPDLIGEYAIEAAGKVAAGDSVDDFIPVELQLITQ